MANWNGRAVLAATLLILAYLVFRPRLGNEYYLVPPPTTPAPAPTSRYTDVPILPAPDLAHDTRLALRFSSALACQNYVADTNPGWTCDHRYVWLWGW